MSKVQHFLIFVIRNTVFVILYLLIEKHLFIVHFLFDFVLLNIQIILTTYKMV